MSSSSASQSAARAADASHLELIESSTPGGAAPSAATADPGLGHELLTGWAKHPAIEGTTRHGEDLERITRDAVLSRGLGRAYADAALPPVGCSRPVAVTPLADRVLTFDSQTGRMRAEAGLSLRSLRNIFLSRGWFTPVSPGTGHVTLGGMVAADIHGKNHHSAGCIGRHVHAVKLRTGDGELREVSRESNRPLFEATLGGMGLTGHILEVELDLERLPSPWIYEESVRFPNLEAMMAGLAEAADAWPMTVAWMDTSARGKNAGRGILMRGRWAEPHEAPAHPPKIKSSVRMPFDFPSGLANPFTFRILNTLWYHKHGSKARSHVVHPESFYWLLDMIDEWNRVFGKRGFTQYQCVLPSEASLFREVLDIFQRMGGCSFVTVFKDCGEVGEGMLSFPQRGTSLALDIPMRRNGETEALCQALNEFVVANGGRIYLAKDAFTSKEHFDRMYPRLEEFRELKRRYDPDGRLESAQARRLGLV